MEYVAPKWLVVQPDLFDAGYTPPLIVSYGMGLDSTAMLLEMHRRGERADAIVFADTGGEHPDTYAYLDTINEWLTRQGWPLVEVVRYAPTRAPYTNLEGKCLANETLPSLAFGKHSCSLVFKVEQLDKWLRHWPPAREAWARGHRVTKCIGYDDSSADRRRRVKADKRPTDGRIAYRYPLQDWHLERTALAEIITAAGLPVPHKSACWFCPAAKLDEVMELKREHPALYRRAVTMEDTARDGKHGLKAAWVQGLGLGGWAWGWIEGCATLEEAKEVIAHKGGKIKAGLRP